MSEEQGVENKEWKVLAVGGLAGLMFVLLANVYSQPPFIDLFAVINVFFFVCLLFSPYMLLYTVLESDRRQRFDVIVLTSYLTFAPIIGLMITCLARGDSYFYGLVKIPNEISWVVVTIIAILLLIPLINLFSLLPIAIWLGSLLYNKVYQGSYLYKALIGSPLFALPLFVFLGSVIYGFMRSRKEEVYIFDKTGGELTRHDPPRQRVSFKKLFAVSLLFLLVSSALTTGYAIWNETEEAKIVSLGDYRVSPQISRSGSYLTIFFSLINIRNKTTTANGAAEVTINNKNGSSIYKTMFGFSERSFKYFEYSKNWLLTCTVSAESLIASVIKKDIPITKLANSVDRFLNPSYATLKVTINNCEKVLTATYPLRFYFDNDTLIWLYYRDEITILQTELNKQWPIKAGISNYFRMGNYCWAVVGRTGGEIIFYPGKIYNWYILQSTDEGNYWDISWKGDNYPLFRVEFLSEKEIRITTSYAIFMTRDGGETWE